MGILAAAWITPALIAGALGWSGIWGTGSALVEYLIPLPVAGGALHVPSMAAAAAVIFSLSRLPRTVARLVPMAAFAVCLGALAAQVDMERLAGWLFTDYRPYGSPLRLDGNPLLLFVTTDAFWVGIYALATAPATPRAAWLVPPIVPAVVMGFGLVAYGGGGPVYEMGGSFNGPIRGQVIKVVYTSGDYDEGRLLRWLDTHDGFARPWVSPNSEHVAVIFTNSLQAVKSRRFEALDDTTTVATFCLYEDDQHIEPHPGRHDCFAGHETTMDRLRRLTAEQRTGLGEDIDRWAARLALCEGVEIPEQRHYDIEIVGLCRDLEASYTRTLERARAKHGAASAHVARVTALAREHGLVR